MSWYAYRFIFGKAIRTMHFDNSVTERFPIPKSVTDSQQKKFAQLIDKIFELQKKYHEKKVVGNEKELLEQQIKQIDWQIDQEIYKLYGITEEEKKIIEGSFR